MSLPTSYSRPVAHTRARIFLLLCLCWLVPASLRAQVVINEFSAVQNDRLLQTTASGLQKLGCLPAWYDLDFAVPSYWQPGVGPFGFGYTQTTNLQASMQNLATVVYLRRDFTLTAGQEGSAEQVELLIDYDDGFIAYLNGVEVARRNTGATGSYGWHHQQAFNTHAATGAETIALGIGSNLLRSGTNVLAIQVHNNDIGNGSLRCDATLRLGGGAPQTLVAAGDTWKWFAGTYEPAGGVYDPADFGGQYQPGPNWTQLAYDDTAWTGAAGALGFDASADYVPQLGVGSNLVNQMRNIVVSIYLRREFTLTQAQYDQLISTSLTVDFDDGYVLYLNGYEISRSNVPGTPGTFVTYSQVASGHGASRDNGGNNPAAIVTVSVPRQMLRVGKNVISAQLHNESAGSSDLLLDVRFSGVSNGSTLTWVTTGSAWKYKLGTTEIGTPAPASAAPPGPEFLDWVELKNNSDFPVDLGGWRLSDEGDQLTKWTFPAGTMIPASGYLVVACSGRDITAPAPGGLLHTNFSLGANGETLYLVSPANVVQSVSAVPDQDAFHTWGRDAASGQFRFLAQGTPGALNAVGTESARALEVEFSHGTGFYASSPTITLTPGNAGAAIRYTQDGSEPGPTSTLYTGPFNPIAQPSIGPGSGTILRELFQWSSGTFVAPANLPANATPTTAQLITSLETPTNTSDYYTHRVRGYLHPPQTGNYQFWLATDDDGELWLSTTDQPSNKVRRAYIQSNWASPREWTKHATQQSVMISLVAGQRYYIEVLQSEGAGGDNLAVGWSGPGLPAGINVIDGRYLSPPATLPAGTTMPPGAGTVRARAFLPGYLPSEVRTRNYVVGLDTRLTTVPAFFFSGPAAKTFYNGDGVFSQVGGNWSAGDWQPNDARFDYNFCVVDGDAFERPAALEIIRPGNAVVERTNVGIRFAGSPYSRPKYQLQNVATAQWNTAEHNKPQINVFFRSDFGISKLKVDGFIPTSNLNEWDTLRLRAGKNDAYNPFIIDEWMRRSYAAMGGPAPQGFFATLFINGQFKSYFNPTERPRESFFQEFYRTDNEFDVNYIGSWENGDSAAHGVMYNFFRNNDFTTLANYQTGATYWDMKNVADYLIINGWGGTNDWPGNNYAFARERAVGAQWRFSMWDAEGAIGRFGQPNTYNTFESDMHISSTNPAINQEGNTIVLVFRRAHQSPEFRLLFADRLQKHFFNGGCMTPANRATRWSGMRAQVEPLIQAVFSSGFYSGNWDNWANRDTVFFQQAQAIGLWPATLAPTASPFGGTVPGGSTVTLGNPNGSGTIFYTTDGSDPRAVGGGLQGTAYTTPIPVSAAFTLKARVRSAGGEWSPLIETGFATPPPKLVVTELNYNPPGSEDATEFLEITNIGGQAASLNGAHFTDGLTFTFGNVTLPAGQSLVLVKDATAFAAAYPGVPVAGVYGGSLDNSGETLTLRDLAENIIFSFAYSGDDTPGWPTSPDGGGYSLVLRRQFAPGNDLNLAANWRASSTVGGAPGTPDSIPFTGSPLADADGDGFSALVEHALGTSDTDGRSLPKMQVRLNSSGFAELAYEHPVAADDVTLEVIDSDTLTPGTTAGFLNLENGTQPGWMKETWRAKTTGAKKFLWIKATLLP